MRFGWRPAAQRPLAGWPVLVSNGPVHRLRGATRAPRQFPQRTRLHSAKQGWNCKQPDANIWSSKIWLVGFLTYASGGLIFAVALGFGPATLLLPLGGLKLVIFAMLAPWCLQEPLGRTEALGIVLVCTGIVGAVVSGSANQPDPELHGVLSRLMQPGFVIYSGSTILGGAAAVLAVRLLRKRMQSSELGPAEQLRSCIGQTLALLYAWLAGIFSSYGVVFIKLMAELLAGGHLSAAFTHPGLYLCISGFILSNMGLEYWRQTGLAVFPAMHIIPACEVALLVTGIVANGILFNEFRDMKVSAVATFWGSICTSAAGIHLLSYREAQNMSFQQAAQVAWRVIHAKNKFKQLVSSPRARYSSGDTEPTTPEPESGKGDEQDSSPLARAPAEFLLGILPRPGVACWYDEDHTPPGEDMQLQTPEVETLLI